MRTALVIAVALAGCGKPPDDAECRAMLDRYVDMTIDGDAELASAPERSRAALRAAKVREKRAGAAYATSLARCKREISRRELDCAMAAPNPNQWEACF